MRASASGLVEHFFRHEYGRLVAILVRRVGVQHVEAVEDAAQSALMRALVVWPARGQPDNPSAWLFRVASNELLGVLRQDSRRREILALNVEPEVNSFESFLPEEVADDLLRMLFVCCHQSIPLKSQLVLALKTLCGFDVREISLRLFTSEANVYKRLARARSQLRSLSSSPEELRMDEYEPRVSSVTKILYQLFTEGYLSSHSELAIRRELCEEALRLVHILVKNPIGQKPEVYALVALMHLHLARLGSRLDSVGGLLLLEEQDRDLWDRGQIQVGLEFLALSAQGEDFSRYHAEAGVAAEHCLAPSFSETRWQRVVECYSLLDRLAPSPLHRLNGAVALAEWKGPFVGLAALEEMGPPSWLEESYQWSAVMADLHRRCGREGAADHRAAALSRAPTEAVRGLLARRLSS